MQKVENIVIPTRDLGGEDYDYTFGEGAEINVLLAPRPLILFLKEEYAKDPGVLNGHIQAFLDRVASIKN